MTPQRARDVERICQAALEQEPSARAAFLVEACAGDAALRREVESLLASESRAAGFLSTPAAAFAWDVSGDGATLIGRRLGPYEIQTRIGGGGMGDVYKARDTRLPRTVAVKVPKAPYSERFRREASAIAQLSHPHICTLHDIGPGYLVMEYVEGTPLKGPLPTERVMAYAGQILDALDAAHRQHVVHRDLKPDNILVTKQGIKLLDFGLAHTESSEEEPTLTGPGDVMGTPAYMAPEQRDGKHSDARSDIYAFGCVLHEMLTGKRVTAARPPAEPPALERVIKRCLAPAPDDRFQTARDLKTALEWAGESQVGTTSTHGWRKPWVAAVLMLVAILAGLGTWAVSSLRQPDIGGPVLRLQITPPEGGWFGVLSGERETLALSPDGRTAVYGASVDGKSALWLRSLDDTAARALPGTEDARQPFWSPDGKAIAFVANGKLQKLDVAGGPAFVICDVSHLRVYGGAWAPDGRILVGIFGGAIASVPASGGTLSPVTTLDRSKGEVVHAWPQVLPGGRFLFMGGTWQKARLFTPHPSRNQTTGSSWSSRTPTPCMRPVRTAGGTSSGSATELWWLRNSTARRSRLWASSVSSRMPLLGRSRTHIWPWPSRPMARCCMQRPPRCSNSPGSIGRGNSWEPWGTPVSTSPFAFHPTASEWRSHAQTLGRTSNSCCSTWTAEASAGREAASARSGLLTVVRFCYGTGQRTPPERCDKNDAGPASRTVVH